MSRQTAETLLLSALVNSEDATAAQQYGITPDQLTGYRDEYIWTLNYRNTYHHSPSRSVFMAQYPDFPFDPSQTDVRWPSEEIRRAHASQKMIRTLLEASELIATGKVEEAYARVHDTRFEVYGSKPTSLLVDPSFLDDYDRVDPYIEVPWPSLQGVTGGIGRGELWYVAARPAQGKSSYLVDLACHAAMSGHRVLIYSLEMSKRQCQVKVHADLGHRLNHRVDSYAMLHGTWDKLAYKRLLQDIEDQVTGEIDIHEAADGAVNPGLVGSRAGEYDLTIVDYTSLMRTNSGNRAVEDWRHLAAISNELKEIVIGKNVSIAAASQINRDGDTLNWRPPGLKHLSQSDALGQDGDVVLTQKRYGKKSAVFSVEKNRHGESANVFFCNFDANNGDFTEITRDTADDLKDNEDD